MRCAHAQRSDDRIAPLAARHETDVAHVAAQRGTEDVLLVSPVAGDDNRGRIAGDGLASRGFGHIPADRCGDRAEGPRDRCIALDDEQWGWDDRLEEDLERATGQALVVHADLARLVLLWNGGDAEQH